MELTPKEHEGTLEEKIEQLDRKTDQVLWEVKYLQRIQTPPVNYFGSYNSVNIVISADILAALHVEQINDDGEEEMNK